MLKAADTIIEVQRAEYPTLADEHPDKILPGQPLLDEFWYYHSDGLVEGTRSVHTQEYVLDSKLNDKNLMMIADQGQKSNMGLQMALPHLVDMVAVKTEFAETGDLEKILKDLMQTTASHILNSSRANLT